MKFRAIGWQQNYNRLMAFVIHSMYTFGQEVMLMFTVFQQRKAHI